MEVVMRLNLASDLIYVIRHCENKAKPGSLVIKDLFGFCQTNLKARRDLQESMESLLSWLFLNARQQKDDAVFMQLGNPSFLTPATLKVKQITDHIEEMLSLLPESDSNEEAIKISLLSLTMIVKKINITILELTTSNSLGFDTSVRLG
jgi:hypothetical protein